MVMKRVLVLLLALALVAACGNDDRDSNGNHHSTSNAGNSKPDARDDDVGVANLQLSQDVKRTIRDAPVECGDSGSSHTFVITEPPGEPNFALIITTKDGQSNAVMQLDELSYGTGDNAEGITTTANEGGSINVTIKTLPQHHAKFVKVVGEFSCR